MKIKTSELTDRALNWAVAYALLDGDVPAGFAAYSFDWSFGGPIIVREGISLQCFWPKDPRKKTWQAVIGMIPVFNDKEPLVAAMRCYVASKLGDEVDIPEGLL